MNIPEFLSQLLALNIQLWVDEERLRYRAHQGALTPDLQAQLVKHKAEIIAYLKESARVNEVAVLPAIQPAQRLEQLPLSYAQERLWFLYQLDPINNAHNIFNAVRLHGPLDLAVLSECFNLVVARHESLRTTFATVAGQATQIVTEKLELSLTLISLQDLPSDEQNNRIKETALQEARRPFDLEHGPLVRVTLLKLDETQHVLLLAMHHIISDGWSAGVLLQEMIRFYEAALLNKPVSLAGLPIQYIDFAIWQREWLQGEVLETQQRYWRNQLANLTVLDLPTDRERSKVTSYAGATYVWELAPSLSSELKRLVQQQESSLFMALLAAFSIVLHRYSQQLDIAVRSPIANRTRKEIEGLIGYFVNTLILRVDMTDHPNFDALLRRVDEVCLGAYAHQDMPFEKVMDDLQLARREGRRHGPLFPVMFILQNAPLSLPNVPGFDFEALDMEDGLAPFELTVAIREINNTLQVNFNYNTDLFEAATMRRMGQHFEQILQAIIANPQQSLSVLAALIPLEEIPTVRGQANIETAYAAPRTPVEETLAKIWAEALGIEKAGIYDNFLESGGDSLLSMSVVARAREAGLHLSPQDIYQYQTIAELANVASMFSRAQTEPDELVVGPVPLTPNQHWFLDQNFYNQRYFTSGGLFEVSEKLRLDVAIIKQVLQHIFIHHDGLRARFVQQGSEWKQFILAPDENPISLETIDISALSAQEQINTIEATCVEARNTLDISNGPILRVIVFDSGVGNKSHFFLFLHHLVTDGFSTNILMQDFMTVYQQLAFGKEVKLPAKTSSVKAWSESLMEYAKSPAILQELDYWKAIPGETLPGIPQPDVPNPSFIFVSGFQVAGTLDVAETRVLLQDVLKTYNMQLIEVMLAAMAEAIGQTKENRSLYVDILRHGRDIPLDNIDLSRTMGWFVIHYPLLLRLENAGSLKDALPQVREQYRRPLNGGVGYDVLRYMSGNKAIQKTLRPRPNVVFSHELLKSTPAANDNALIRPSSHFSGKPTNGEISWPYLLELRTVVSDNQLGWVWTSGESVYKRSTIEQVSQNFGDILRKLCNSVS